MTYEEELKEYKAHIRKIADSIGYKFTPIPPAPKRGTADFEESVDAFMNCLPVFVGGVTSQSVALTKANCYKHGFSFQDGRFV